MHCNAEIFIEYDCLHASCNCYTHTRFTCIPFECALRRETVFTFYALFKSFFYDSIVHINEYRFECFIQNGNRIIPSTTTKTTRKTEIWLRILKDILFLHWHQSLKLQLWSYFVKHLMPETAPCNKLFDDCYGAYDWTFVQRILEVSEMKWKYFQRKLLNPPNCVWKQ